MSMSARRFPGLLMVAAFALAALSAATPLRAQADAELILPFHDPVFDMQLIAHDPLDVTVLETKEQGSVVIERLEFTSDVGPDGEPIRTFGILAYPKGGKDLPVIMWGQGGMAPAGEWFPVTFAKKGYMSLSVTLPREQWNAWDMFDWRNPRDANLVRLAKTHMRGITLLCSRPEADADRVGMAGASYGGVYATLVAGADPRVKAGMSFFSGGNHALGTNLPQFNKMPSLEAVEAFNETADGAWRLAQRPDVAYLWGVSANDNWFHLPAVVQTFDDAASERCRMAIIPSWQHGFPPHIDQMLIDWFDTQLKGDRAAYNKPGSLAIEVREGELVGQWTWTGENKVEKAELVASYGPAIPWHGWVNRYHHPFEATIDGQSASGTIPVPHPDTPIHVFANITDENAVVTSTMPVIVTPRDLGLTAATRRPQLNAAPLGEFEEADVTQLAGQAMMIGVSDDAVAHGGERSVRLDPPKPGGRQPLGKFKLHHAYEHDHRLSVWLRASEPTKVFVGAHPIAPRNWNQPAVQAILPTIEGARWPLPEGAAWTPIEREVELTEHWRQVTIDVPWTLPVEGHELRVQQKEGGAASYWLDDVAFEPVWK